MNAWNQTTGWQYGLSVAQICTLTGYNITPIYGGIINYYGSDGDVNLTDFGACMQPNGAWWTPACYYTTSGSTTKANGIGGWGYDHFGLNARIWGTCYGAIA